jgi:sensor histidine kinase YesM
MENTCEQPWTRKRILSELFETLVLAALGILMTVSGLTCRDCIDNTFEFWVIASFTALMWVALWKGNSALTNYISKKISWIEFPLRRLTIGFICTIAYTLGVMYLLGAIYYFSFDINLTSGAWYSVIITLIISLFLHGRAFLINWKQSAVIAEQLKKENIAARYESLKNQVNPHFLFNSLNALTNLVYEDQDKAVKFIKQLSEVYRYVLDTREKEIVPLSAELDFLKSYIFLQQIRFGDKLQIEMEVDVNNKFIAPLALQMLIENAIKHNVVSEADPLYVNILIQDDYLVISNNVQRKRSLGETSSGIGLENIRKRYEFLSARPVVVSEDAKKFNVKVPLIHEL